MSLEKIGLTLYDFLGYILPGYVLLFGCSLIESTFFPTSDLFALSHMADYLLLSAVTAYLLGQAAHSIGSLLKEWRPQWFSGRRYRLSSAVFERARQVAQDTYQIELEPGEKLNTLETYLLADSYIVASESSTERDILMAREGFHKTSMVALGLTFVVLFSCSIAGGASIQTEPGVFIQLSRIATTVQAVLMLSLALLFRRGFIFYNRIKINNTLLTFLALREKDCLKKGN